MNARDLAAIIAELHTYAAEFGQRPVPVSRNQLALAIDPESAKRLSKRFAEIANQLLVLIPTTPVVMKET